MPGSLRLGKIAGIEIYAHLSWFIILVLLTWSLTQDWFAQLFPGWATTTYWMAAFISALLLFVCVLAHELAHALIAGLSCLASYAAVNNRFTPSGPVLEAFTDSLQLLHRAIS